MVLESNTYIDISPYHEILSGMSFILSTSVGVVQLTGAKGTGKTRLLQQIEAELEARRQDALLFPAPPASIREVHDRITHKLKLDNEFGFNKALIHHIAAKPDDRQRLVLLFDNAEQIDIDVLLAIALFRSILHNNQPVISIVLCGGEALDTKLEDEAYRPLMQDLLLSYEIHPLTRLQLQAYGHACADIHQLGKLPLKNGVLTQLLNESKGLPGPVPELLQQLKAKMESGAPAVKEEAHPEPVAVIVDTTQLSADERLILASRAEKEAAAGSVLAIDWQRWKPAVQRTAMAAGLVAAAVVAWPRTAPSVSALYLSLTDAPAPKTRVDARSAAPAAIVASAMPAEESAAETARPASEAAMAEAPLAATELVAEEEAIAVPEHQVAAVEPQTSASARPGPAASAPDELEALIRGWLMAWEQQDVDKLFSYYHTDFAPLYQNTLSDWRADRQTKISRPASITIELEDFMVGPTSRLGTRVSFWMTYASPTYADRTLKEVLIGPDLDGRWRILQEYNQQTAPLGPVSRFSYSAKPL